MAMIFLPFILSQNLQLTKHLQELSPHKSVPLNETGKGYWPPYEIDTPKHDSDILLALCSVKLIHEEF